MSDENVTNGGFYMVLDGDLEGKFEFNTRSRIGSGNFGKIFKGRNVHTFEEVAIKVEPIQSMNLLQENYFYKILGVTKRNHNVPGLPEIYCVRNIGLECTALAMELLGPSLHELFGRCGKRFSLKTVLMIASQAITRIKYAHGCGLIHRDLKPENFLTGRPQQSLPYKESTENVIYLIDFGMAKLYVNINTKAHIPYKKDAGVFGTYQFMSANAHINIEQSRRDDLETLGYMLLYLVNGSLPWSIYMNDEFMKERCEKMKNSITVKELCGGLPDEFAKYFNYVKRLGFNRDPDYDMLKTLFDSVYERNKYPNDMLFDWSTL